ncbi:MAG: lamin tail domain-containing protein [Pontiellaceae bacterium]|jgi:hypothetical protein|nr:lamin tail domain-containing protein [Pontiellaceae bacterium]
MKKLPILLLVSLAFLSTASAAYDVTIGAYYYPWYHTQTNLSTHWKSGYARQKLSNPQLPSLNEYSSRDANVLKSHFNWARGNGIDMFICSWWGSNSFEDVTLKDYFCKSADIGTFKYCILYEALADYCLGAYTNSQGLIEFSTASKQKMYNDFAYLSQKYFTDDNYFKYNGNPVVFFYVSRVFRGAITDAFTYLRTNIKNNYGFTLYLVGDELEWENKPDFSRINVFDAVTSYTMYSDIQEQDQRLVFADDIWFLQDVVLKYDYTKKAVEKMGKKFIPGCQPGFNDRGVRLGADHYVLSHERVSTNANKNSLFTDYLKIAGRYVDGGLKLMTVTSFNEWHEDTQVEPTKTGIAATRLPFTYTLNENHYAYGTNLLNFIRKFSAAYTGPAPYAKTANIVINEVCPSTGGNDNAKYIELYNKGTNAVNLSGWRIGLQSKFENYDNYQVRLSGTIPAKGCFLIGTAEYNNLNLPDANLVENTGLKARLSADNAAIGLRDPNGLKVDGVGYACAASFTHDYVETTNKYLVNGFPNNQSLSRNASHTDSDHNANDFSLSAQSPVNAPVGLAGVILTNGNNLLDGEVRNYPSLNCYLTMQNDGNLVLYRGAPGASQGVIWSAGISYAIGDYFATLQSDGNLVIYKGTPTAAGIAVYASCSAGTTGNYLFGMLSSGRLVIAKGTSVSMGEEVWSNVKSRFVTGNMLQKNEIIKDPVRNIFLMVLGDGNMAAFDGTGYDDPNKQAFWSTGTTGGTSMSYFLNLQNDGNLVLYNGTPLNPGTSRWASGISSANGTYFFKFDATDKMPSIYRGTPEAPGTLLWKATAP